MIKAFEADPHSAPIPLFAGFPCAKDSDWNRRFPGRSNAVIMTLANFDWFKEWEHEPQGKRGPKYEALKKMLEERILEEGLYKFYPHTRGTVDFTMVGSSLTFNHYIRSHRGEVYGLESHPDQLARLLAQRCPRSPQAMPRESSRPPLKPRFPRATGAC